jgi:hypothetical protein
VGVEVFPHSLAQSELALSDTGAAAVLVATACGSRARIFTFTDRMGRSAMKV